MGWVFCNFAPQMIINYLEINTVQTQVSSRMVRSKRLRARELDDTKKKMKMPNENKLLKLFPTILQVQQFKHKMTHQQVSADARTFVVLQQHTTTDFVFFAASLQQQQISNEKEKEGG